MKNAMKRIMGLLLVAVLLVSVVPFQALAAEVKGGTDYKGFQSIEVRFGDEVKTTAWVEDLGNPETKTIKDILDHFYGDWSKNYRFRDASYGGQDGISDINTVLHTNFEDTSVVINLYGIPQFKATVTYKLDGSGEVRGYAEFTRKDGESLNFDDIAKSAPEQDAYKVDRVVVGDSEYRSGSFKVNSELYPVAYLVAKNGGSNNGNQGTPEAGKLNAQYYVNGVLRSEAYDVDGKTVSELVSDSKLGNYNANNYNISAKVGNTSKGMNDVIYRGETVAITMTSKTQNTPSTPGTSQVVAANYYVNGDYKATKEYAVEGKTVSELIDMGGYKASNYTNITASVNGVSKTMNSVIKQGETVNIYMKTKASNKFPYDVYLHVFLNNDVSSPDRTIKISDDNSPATYLAGDGVVSLSEVQSMLSDRYYKAKNSKGINYDGLFIAEGNWRANWTRDDAKYNTITGVQEMAQEHEVNIIVVLNNAVRKTSSTADSSNPKTGDAIFMTITVMGLSAAALTGLYFYDKKRKAL